MKKYIAILFVALFAVACAGSPESKAPEATEPAVEVATEAATAEVDTTMAAEADSTAMEVTEEAAAE